MSNDKLQRSSSADGSARRIVSTLPLFYWDIIWLASVFVLLLACYYPAFNGPFAFDDYAVQDSISRLPSWNEWKRPETRPLVTLSFVIERRLLGTAPFVHRFGNIVIHTIAAYLLSRVVRTAFERYPSRFLSSQMFAYLVATIWAIHPLQAESVAYIVQRGESLMGMFYFAFIFCLMRDSQQRSGHVVDRHSDNRPQSIFTMLYAFRWQLLAVFCFLCGLWSKTVMITALAVAPLYDRAFLSDTWHQVLRARGWVYLAPIAGGMVAVVSILPGVLRGDANVGFGGDAPPLANYLAAEAKVIWIYLVSSCLPSDLSIDHGMIAPAFWQSNLLWIVLTGGLVLAGVIACFRSRYALGFLILTPLLILAPTSSIIPTADLLVEHRMYVPLSVVIAALLVISAWLAGRSQQSSAKVLLMALVILCCVGLSLRTWLRAADYASGIALWSQAVKSNPANDRAIQNLLDSFKREVGEDQTAYSQRLQAILLDAVQGCEARGIATTVPLHRLGESLVKLGRYEDSVPILRKAIEQDEAEPSAGYQPPQRYRSRAAMHIDLAIALMSVGQLTAALVELETAFTIHDYSPDARAIAGSLCKQLQRPHDAKLHWERSLVLRPGWKEVERDLGKITSE